MFENPCRNDGRVGLKVHYIADTRHLHPGTCSFSVSRIEGPNRLFSCLSGPLKTKGPSVNIDVFLETILVRLGGRGFEPCASFRASENIDVNI